MNAHVFYKNEFVDNLCLSLMNVVMIESKTSIKSGTIHFEADVYDDISIDLGWIAITDNNQDSNQLFSHHKTRSNFKIGFDKGQIAEVNGLILVDDDTDEELNKDEMSNFLKSFIHENFLWEDDVVALISNGDVCNS